MKNLYIVFGVLILSIIFNVKTVTAQYSFGDDVDSIDFGSDGSIKFEDAVDSIDVGGVEVDSSGKVEVKDIKFQDSTDSIKVDSVEVDQKGNFEVEGVEVKDSVDSIKVDSVKGKIEKSEEDSIFEISIDADDFEFDLEENERAEVEIEDAEEVETADDLKVYVSGNIKKNKSIEKVDFDDDAMFVEYKGKGRLFGFIPVGLAYKVNVADDNSVEVKLPWWHIFAWKKASAAEVKAQVETELEDSEQATITVSTNASAKLKTKAQTFSIVIGTLSVKIK